MSSPPPLDILDFAIATARAAGRLLMERFRPTGGGPAIEKKGIRELVTEADRSSETLIVQQIRERFSHHAILAEEGSSSDTDDSQGLWLVDPLDGTTNFAHGLPPWAVSLAFRQSGQPLVGVVHAPYLDETWLAARGHGAWLEQAGRRQQIHVSSESELVDAVLATGFAYNLGETANDNLESWARLVRSSRAVRRCGAAALDLCWLASGRFDGFWELYLQPYDVAAGGAIVLEAGGEVTDFAGGQDWVFGRSIVASNGALHETLRRQLAPLVDDGTLPPSAFGC